MKLTDFVAEFLANQGIEHVFGLTGGAVVHLFDSLEKHPRIQPIYNHHEQAASFAAEAYSRVTNNLGVAFVTTGPGGTNAITGLLAAHLDSVPCIYVSGQSRFEQTSRGKPVRQIGTQEFDIISLVSNITKYAVMVDDPKNIKYCLQKAVYLARTGRPGPVWIDIPLNFQWTDIQPNELKEFYPDHITEDKTSELYLRKSVEQCFELILKAKRPLIMAGYGIRLSHAETEFKELILKLKVPFVSGWNTRDLLPTNDPLYAGLIGVAGQRGGNLAIQNCDLLLAIGSHLSIGLTGTNFNAFAREAKKVAVDIDPIELDNGNIKVDLKIQCDAKLFLSEIEKLTKKNKELDISFWREKCLKYKSYNSIPKEWWNQKEFVNPYIFIDFLSDQLSSDDVIVVDGGGTALYMSFQALKIKKGQRLIVSSAVGSMGTGLPESIGACFANNCMRTICMTGDGSLQLNIQELQTICHHNLPIKLFVFNNEGYLAIRHTQDGFLESEYTGTCSSGGLSLPDFQKVGQAYGLKIIRINNNHELKDKIKLALEEKGPVLCEIMISPNQQLIPRQGFYQKKDGTFAGKSLEDMDPPLERKEFLENMVVKPWVYE